MNQHTDELKKAKSPEELLLLAKENGIHLTAEEADTYFAQMHSNDLDDDLLEGVAGGWLLGGAGQESATEALRKKSGRSQCE